MNAKPFILIVEDDDRLRGIESRYLTTSGYMVLEAASFREALDRISIKPSVMVLDINLPDVNGWEVARWLERQVSDVPIIVTSGLPADPKQFEHFKPVAFVEKPFKVEQLLSIIQEYAPVKRPGTQPQQG